MALSFDIGFGKFRFGFNNSRSIPNFGRSGISLDNIISSGKISKRTALKISTVFTCLNVLGESVAALPFDVKQETKSGKVTRYDHPAYKLIHDRPNPFTNAYDFWNTQVKLCKAWGNAYALIQHQDVDPVALWILPPWDVEIKVTNGQVFYHHLPTKTVYSHTDILHFKNFSLNGIEGLSTIQENINTVGHRDKLQKYNMGLVGNRPHGYLTAPNPPKDANAKKNVSEMWQKTEDKSSGPSVDRIGEIPLLYGGIEFKALTLPAEAVAYIDSLKGTDQEIYGMFRVPPTLAQNYERATFSNAEQQDLVFVKHTLTPILRMIEQECNAKLFRSDNYMSNEPLFCRFNLNGILRGDLNAQKEFFKTMIVNGVYSPNRVLELLDENTYEGGDRRYMQGAMVPVDLIEDFYKTKSGTKKNKVSAEAKERLKQSFNGRTQEILDILNG